MKLLIATTVFCFAMTSLHSNAQTAVTPAAPANASIDVFVDFSRDNFPADGGLPLGQVALTFDDGPDPVLTPKILAALKKHGMKATFFLIGIKALSHPELVRQILNEGHAIGSHTWNHQEQTRIPLTAAIEDIRHGHSAVEMAAGENFHSIYFRFPQEATTPALVEGVKNLGLVAFVANLVAEDYHIPTPAGVLARVLSRVDSEKRGIVLFHDIYPQTAQMMDAFLTELEARGYKTVVFRPTPLQTADDGNGDGFNFLGSDATTFIHTEKYPKKPELF